jgi:hypothetical protein
MNKKGKKKRRTKLGINKKKKEIEKHIERSHPTVTRAVTGHLPPHDRTVRDGWSICRWP